MEKILSPGPSRSQKVLLFLVLMPEILPLEVHSLTLKVLTFKSSLLECRYSREGEELEVFLNHHLGEDSVIAELRAVALKNWDER